MSPDQIKDARRRLGMSTSELAQILRLGESGSVTVRRWESGSRAPAGPTTVAIQALLDGWRPRNE